MLAAAYWVDDKLGLYGSYIYNALEPAVHWIYTIEGKAILQTNQGNYLLEPGHDLVFTVPCQAKIIRFDTSSLWRHLAFYFIGDWANAFFDQSIREYGNYHAIPFESPVIEDAVSIAESLIGTQNVDPHLLSGRAYAWAMQWYKAVSQYATSQPSHSQYMISSSPLLGSGQKSVTELARSLGYSERHISRMLKKMWNRTPGNILKNNRLERAKRLLRQPGTRVSDIAIQVGYNSPSSFIRAFKRAYGSTPHQYASNID